MKTFRNIAVMAALAGAVALPGFAHASDLLSSSSSVSFGANILNLLSVALGLNIAT